MDHTSVLASDLNISDDTSFCTGSSHQHHKLQYVECVPMVNPFQQTQGANMNSSDEIEPSQFCTLLLDIYTSSPQ